MLSGGITTRTTGPVLHFVLRRLGITVLTMLAVSMLVFLLLEFDPGSVAVKVLGPYSSEEQRKLWMAAHGYLDPLWQRYLTWLGHVLTGDFGESIRFKVPVSEVLWRSEEHTSELQSIMRISYAVF